MGLLTKMKKQVDFTDKEKSISNYLLENNEKIIDMSSREVGTHTYTSSSSIVRFCQKIGCKGYSDFKVKFLSEIKYTDFSECSDDMELNQKDNALSILNKISTTQKQVIDETKNELSIAQFVKITNYIVKAEYIDFFAYDLNLHLAEYACNQFFHCGKISNVYSASNAQHLLALNAKNNHIGIFISRGGENIKLIETAKLLKESKVKTIVITSNKNSTLAKICDDFIYAVYADRIENLGTIMFSTSVKYIIDSLFSMIFVNHYDESVNLNNTYDKFGQKAIYK